MIFDFAIALAMMLIGCYGLYEMAALPKLRGDGIGPAFYPALLSAILICLSSILLVKSFVSIRKDTSQRTVPPKGIHTYGQVFVLLFSTLVYGMLLETIGFPLLTMVLVGGLAYMLDPGFLYRKLAFSLVFTIAAWLIFEWFLGLPLPLGVLRIII